MREADRMRFSTSENAINLNGFYVKAIWCCFLMCVVNCVYMMTN